VNSANNAHFIDLHCLCSIFSESVM
jgi:hypothetical protein